MTNDELSFFLAENVEQVEPVEIAVSKRIKDADGNPIVWKIKPVPTEIANVIQNECIVGKGKDRNFDMVKYQQKMAAASVIYPNLNNAQLQDSWGVRTPDALLMKMLSDPMEFNVVFAIATGTTSGEAFEELVNEAKN